MSRLNDLKMLRNKIVEGGVALSSKAWEPPTPLESSQHLPEFPIACLPDALGNYAAAVAEDMQVAVDMPGICALNIAAICLQRKFKIAAGASWQEPLNLFAAIVAKPGERKSGVISTMTQPLLEFEEEENKLRRADIKRTSAQREMLEKKMRRLSDKAANNKGSFEDVMAVQAELDELEEVHPLQLFTSDTTAEALIRVLCENEGRAAVLSAEGGIFQTMSGLYSKTPNFDVYLQGHAGDTIRTNRLNRGQDYVKDPALCMLLMIQPSVLEGLMDNKEFRGKGLIGRFLYAIPASPIGRRKIVTESPSFELYVDYRKKVFELLQISVPESEEIIALSEEAFALSVDFAEKLEPRLIDDLEDIQDWASKFRGAVMRIAGILHTVTYGRDALEHKISVSTMQSAIFIGDYFLAHAQAAYSQMGADKRTQDAKYILRQLKKENHSELPRRELHRMCRGRLKTIEALTPALDFLMESGYIRQQQPQREGAGRKPDIQISVNPYLYGQNGHNGLNC